MSLEVPTDLIHQAQIGFREDAGISSFDPDDSSLRSLPTVDASIAALDPSPPRLRCKHCEGKLLRGLQSLICVFCGKYPKKDNAPEPICFNSTVGYQWLLHSLNLNGSERIDPPGEENGRNRRNNRPEYKVILSELLDLQIQWSDVPDKLDANSKRQTFEHGRNSLNLSTVDLDKFFTGSKRDIVSSEEQPVTSKKDQSGAFVDQENRSPFVHVPPPETAITSSIDASDDASPRWNAEFKPVDSRMQNE